MRQNLDSGYIVLRLFQDTPFSAASTSPNVQFQPSYAPFPEIQMGTYSTQVSYDVVQGVAQDPYLPLPYASHPSYVPPRTAIASFDDNVRDLVHYSLSTPLYEFLGSQVHATQWNENIGMGLSDVGLMWPPTVVPATPQASPPKIYPRRGSSSHERSSHSYLSPHLQP